eukprot:XP_025981112.1 probable aldo-keto reductase 1 [Glycine max]
MSSRRMGELKKLVEEDKGKYIGLSVQMAWSLWTRDIEDDTVPLCRELGIGIVPYSPLGRGFFGGKGIVENFIANSFLIQGSCLDNVPVHVISMETVLMEGATAFLDFMVMIAVDARELLRMVEKDHQGGVKKSIL